MRFSEKKWKTNQYGIAVVTIKNIYIFAASTPRRFYAVMLAILLENNEALCSSCD